MTTEHSPATDPAPPKTSDPLVRAKAWWDFLYPICTFAGGTLASWHWIDTSEHKIAAILAVLLAAFVVYLVVRRRRRDAETRRKREARLAVSRTVLPGSSLRRLLSYEATNILPGMNRRKQAVSLSEGIAHPDFCWGVLKGPVGCGKTSLLRSVVVPRLEEKGFRVALLRSPQALLRKALGGTPTQTDRLAAFCQAATALCESHLERNASILIVDQFEELFAEFSGLDLEHLGAYFASLLSGYGVRTLCSIREDYSGRLFSLKLPHVEPLASRTTTTLENFGVDEATSVILECAQADGHAIDVAFANTIARDLAQSGTTVRPPELQLVLGDIIDKNLDPAGFQAMGGAQGLLASFLRNSIADCRQPDFASRVLRALGVFGSSPTRVPRTLESLADALGLSPNDGAQLSLLRETLVHFIGTTLVVAEGSTFSLAHDYLLDPVRMATTNISRMTEEADRQLLALNAPDVFHRTAIISPLKRRSILKNASADLLRRGDIAASLRKASHRFWVRWFSFAAILLVVVSLAEILLGTRTVWKRVTLARTSPNSPGVWEICDMVSTPQSSIWTLLLGHARLWSVNDGSELYAYDSPKDEPLGLATSPSGRLLLVAEQELKVTDVVSGKTTTLPLASPSWIGGPSLPPPLPTSGGGLPTDSGFLVLPSGERALFDATERFMLTVRTQPVLPGDPSVSSLRLYSVDRGALVATLPNVSLLYENALMKVSSSGDRVVFPVIRSGHTFAGLWKVDDPKPVLIPLEMNESSSLLSVAVDDVHNLAATVEVGRLGRTLALWDLRSGTALSHRLLASQIYELVGSRTGFSFDGRYLYIFAPTLTTVPEGNWVTVMSTSTLLPAQGLPDMVQLVGASVMTHQATGPSVVAWPTKNGALVWDLSTEKPSELVGEPKKTIWLALTSDGRKMLGIQRDLNRVVLWDLKLEQLLSTIAPQQTIRGAGFSLDERAIIVRLDGNSTSVYETSGVLVSKFTDVQDSSVLSYDPKCHVVHEWSEDGIVARYSRGVNVPLFGFLGQRPCGVR